MDNKDCYNIPSVGDTPIIYYDGLYYKLETKNATGSIKDRAAYNILKTYINNGVLKKGDTIIEATGGNMGIALAYFGRLFGLKVVIVMPKNASPERINLLKKYHAKVVLACCDIEVTLRVVGGLVSRCGFFNIDQFNNLLNKEAHIKTGEEILQDLPDVDCVISGIGTSGHICGIGETIKKVKKDVLIIGIEPAESPVITTGVAGPHLIQGIGAGFLPPMFDDKIVDHVECVKSLDVIEEFKTNNPLGLGLTSTASKLVALKVKKEHPDMKILIMVTDGKDRYESLIK